MIIKFNFTWSGTKLRQVRRLNFRENWDILKIISWDWIAQLLNWNWVLELKATVEHLLVWLEKFQSLHWIFIVSLVKNFPYSIKTEEQGCLGGSVSYPSAFGLGHNRRALGSSPVLGSLISGEPASLSPYATPLTCALWLSISLCQINK